MKVAVPLESGVGGRGEELVKTLVKGGSTVIVGDAACRDGFPVLFDVRQECVINLGVNFGVVYGSRSDVRFVGGPCLP